MPSCKPDFCIDHLLPTKVDAIKFCQQGIQISGFLPLIGLHRLAHELQVDDGKVFACLFLNIDEQSRKTVTGRVEAVLPVTCQRCLGRMEVVVTSEVALGLVWSDDQAARLPRYLDPILMASEELSIEDVIEDELLLALPLVAMHESGVCEVPGSSKATLLIDNFAEEKVNPFQVLAVLKKDTENT